MISRRVFWTLFIVTLASSFLLWIVSVLIQHESRSVSRLLKSGVIKNPKNVQLVYSEGILRENTHIFRVPTESIAIDAAHQLHKTDKVGSANIDRVKPFFDTAKINDINWERATCFQREGEDILALITIVLSDANEAYVVMEVF